MVHFHPGLHQTSTIPFSGEHELINLVFTASDGELDHLELWTDLPDGDWNAIPFVVAHEAKQVKDDSFPTSIDATALVITTSLPPVTTPPHRHEATARTTVKPTARSFSYTFRSSAGGNVKWLGDMGSNGTIVFEPSNAASETTVFGKALGGVIQVAPDELEHARGVVIDVTDGYVITTPDAQLTFRSVPKFNNLLSASTPNLGLMLLQPLAPPTAFFNYVPPSPWAAAVVALSQSSAMLAASQTPNLSSCLGRFGNETRFKPLGLKFQNSALAMTYGSAQTPSHLMLYDPNPIPDAIYHIQAEFKKPMAVVEGATFPRFITNDLTVRYESSAPGPLGAVLKIIEAERLDCDGIEALICAPKAISAKHYKACPSPAFAPPPAAEGEEESEYEPTAELSADAELGFWARIAQGLKTFWTVYVLGLFTNAFKSSNDPLDDETDQAEESDEDRTVVGERTPLLRDVSLPLQQQIAHQLTGQLTADKSNDHSLRPSLIPAGIAFTFTHPPPFTFAFSNRGIVDNLRFQAAGSIVDPSRGSGDSDGMWLTVGSAQDAPKDEWEIRVSLV